MEFAAINRVKVRGILRFAFVGILLTVIIPTTLLAVRIVFSPLTSRAKLIVSEIWS
jgi:hypothetical protein